MKSTMAAVIATALLTVTGATSSVLAAVPKVNSEHITGGQQQALLLARATLKNDNRLLARRSPVKSSRVTFAPDWKR